MQDLRTKTWFIEKEGRRLGPYSVHELQEQFAGKKIDLRVLLWKNGMKEAKSLCEIPEIAGYFSGNDGEEFEKTVVSQATPLVTKLTEPKKPQPKSEPEVIRSLEIEGTKTKAAPSSVSTPFRIQPVSSTGSLTAKKSDSGWMGIVFLAVLSSIMLWAYFRDPRGNQKVLDSNRGAPAAVMPQVLQDALKQFKPFIPESKDLSKEDRARLLLAAQTDFKTRGPVMAIALARGTQKQPIFYVSGNLPGEVTLVFHLSAPNKDKKLNAPVIHAGSVFMLRNGFARVGPIKPTHPGLKGQLPLATYEATIYDKQSQSDVANGLLNWRGSDRNGVPDGLSRARLAHWGETFTVGKKL